MSKNLSSRIGKKTGLTLLATLMIMLSAGAAAQNLPEQVETDPGVIPAGVPVLSSADRVVDDVSVAVGLRTQADIVYERASESSQAFENNRTELGQRMMNMTAERAQKASGINATGLEKAEKVLNRVQENAPEEAMKGLETALGNIDEAKNRMPETPGDREKPSNTPDSGAMP